MSEAIDFNAAAEALRPGRKPVPEGPDPRRLITPGNLFEEYLERKSVSIATPWPRLTQALSGGWETRRNHVVTAQAGAGKTAFIVQSIAHAVTHGGFYGVLALRDGDQWADGVRLAQFVGVDRFKLRDRDPLEMERAREVMAGYSERLMFYDVTAKGACIADMVERGRTWAGGRGPLVVGTDSIHVMPYADPGKEAAMSLYERIGFRLEALHDDLVRFDIAALTTAQAGREAYRRKRNEENVEEIAAISGGHVAENTIDLLLNIGKPTAEGVRWMLIPKSRIGGQGERIPLIYDADRSWWTETEASAEPEDRGSRAAARAKAREDARDETERKRREGVALYLRRNPEGESASGIAKATGRGRNWVSDVLADFNAKGWIESVVVKRPDARGRELSVSAWAWKTRAV